MPFQSKDSFISGRRRLLRRTPFLLLGGWWRLFGGGLLGGRLCRGWLGWGGGVCEGLINVPVELLVGSFDLDERSAFAACGDDEDGGGVVDAGALADVVVGLDVGGELALGVEGKRQGDAVGLGKLVSELPQQVRVVVEGGLISEDLVAVLFAEGLAFGVEPAGIDGGDGTPGVLGDCLLYTSILARFLSAERLGWFLALLTISAKLPSKY